MSRYPTGTPDIPTLLTMIEGFGLGLRSLGHDNGLPDWVDDLRDQLDASEARGTGPWEDMARADAIEREAENPADTSARRKYEALIEALKITSAQAESPGQVERFAAQLRGYFETISEYRKTITGQTERAPTPGELSSLLARHTDLAGSMQAAMDKLGLVQRYQVPKVVGQLMELRDLISGYPGVRSGVGLEATIADVRVLVEDARPRARGVKAPESGPDRRERPSEPTAVCPDPEAHSGSQSARGEKPRIVSLDDGSIRVATGATLVPCWPNGRPIVGESVRVFDGSRIKMPIPEGAEWRHLLVFESVLTSIGQDGS